MFSRMQQAINGSYELTLCRLTINPSNPTRSSVGDGVYYLHADSSVASKEHRAYTFGYQQALLDRAKRGKAVKP